MITCKQATEWIIKKEQGKLSAKQHIQMLPHLAICSMCRLFETQSSLISKAVGYNTYPKETHLSNDEKKELIHSVKKRLEN